MNYLQKFGSYPKTDLRMNCYLREMLMQFDVKHDHITFSHHYNAKSYGGEISAKIDAFNLLSN